MLNKSNYIDIIVVQCTINQEDDNTEFNVIKVKWKIKFN